MTFMVTESCIKCKYTHCVDVCPTDAFREGPNFLVIHPDDCIDCTLCVRECPVEAIFAEDDVPPDQHDFTPLNAELAKKWQPIIAMKPALPQRQRMGEDQRQIPLACALTDFFFNWAQPVMAAKKFKVGDHMTWNSEAGHVGGKIIKVHTRNADYEGYTHHASQDDPQYEIKIDKTDPIAMHKGTAQKKTCV